MSDEFMFLDATAQAELVRRGQVQPIELVDAAIARIERLDPLLNAVVTRLFAQARAQARSALLPADPFCGVPLLLKDFLCQTAGDPYYEGMRFLRDLGWRADADTHLAARFRRAGFVVLGKTNLPELVALATIESATQFWLHDEDFRSKCLCACCDEMSDFVSRKTYNVGTRLMLGCPLPVNSLTMPTQDFN
jgi:Asp-tRNA(Asn)/Glu-tRNA(Gln) amidotransferase A subunit family amidase